MRIGNYLLTWIDVLDIFLCTILFYFVLKFILRTNIRGILKFLLLFIIVHLLVTQLNLTLLSWIWKNFCIFIPLAFIILFQPELRYFFLKQSTKSEYYRPSTLTPSHINVELLKAMMLLAKDKVGAILVIEREVNLDEIMRSGIKIDAGLSAELIYSIFLSSSLLHDGAAIIRGDRIVAVGCRLPLSRAKLPATLGMRHRAALGIAEETDALALASSEEKGTISAAYKGRFFFNIEEKELISLLSS
jgi:diadenylate cyclase